MWPQSPLRGPVGQALAQPAQGPTLGPASATNHVEYSSLVMFWLQVFSFLFPLAEAWVYLESLIFHAPGWQRKKSVSVADRTMCKFLDYLLYCQKRLGNI